MENDVVLAFLDVKLTRKSSGCLDYNLQKTNIHRPIPELSIGPRSFTTGVLKLLVLCSP